MSTSAQALRKFQELHESGATLKRAAAEWFEPGALIDGLAAMQFTGLWTFPQLVASLGDDVGVLPWPALDEMGNPSVPLGAYGSCVSAKACCVRRLASESDEFTRTNSSFAVLVSS